jgi:nucleolar protein 53
MAETSILPPSQFSQPSRKGKKAWRKNVDLTEIQEGLEQVNAEIITGYTTLQSYPPSLHRDANLANAAES